MKNLLSKRFKTLGIMLSLAILMTIPTALFAADPYPTKPVRIVIPFPPGGSNDIVGRLIAAKLTERLGKQVIAENKGGAGGVLGTEMASKAEPDGYTLLIISAAHAINPALYKLPYDHDKAFVPVARLGSGPNVLAAHPSVPANSVKELIALAKKQPGKLIYPSAGTGTFKHLSGELFKSMAGIDIMIVQFKGGGPAIVDLLGGHSHFSLGSLAESMSHIKSGKLKALGVGGKKRTVALPDVPTISESGLPGYESTNWWGLLAPAGTPKTVVERLNKELAVIMNAPETMKIFEEQGAEADYAGPAEFGAFIDAETAKWAKVVKQANIKVE